MGKLLLIPTPIGNLGDITVRGKEALAEADCIYAEDTRTSRKLLNLLGIQGTLRSFHMHNEHDTVDQVIASIQSSQGHVALISDAGTPGISDPGFLLVRACIEAGIQVESLPGATAIIPALVGSGIPCDRFVFEGFLPVKKGRK
ncbi:MAG: 16S rRNA (cytidine(1402)-2'-O)-methyltransferase, partial [Schleiferiaceae bacterium]|nr:16S rRNA (cytidine(1402)-2'-O)-methyltransferase [Schleiferiaceae bacterium]